MQEAKRLQKEGGSNKMATNFVRAFQLFLRAAEGGHVEAQYQVAECYVWGAGVPHDIVESDRWLRLAAENGHMYAQSDLGVYRLGKSEESVKWLRKAAEQGESSAFDFLGFRLVSGAGVPQDKCEGYAWLRLAVDARKEDNWLQEQVAAIASSLSSAQLEKALELYEGFKRKYSTE